MAEHYKAFYVLGARGGATAPGAALSLRPTGKAAGGAGTSSIDRLEAAKNKIEDKMMDANREAQRLEDRAEREMRAGREDIAQRYFGEAQEQRQKAERYQSEIYPILEALQALRK